jgi:choline dehydrogenase
MRYVPVAGPLASMGLYVGAFMRSDRRLDDRRINMFAWRSGTDLRRRHSTPFSAFSLSPVHLSGRPRHGAS